MQHGLDIQSSHQAALTKLGQSGYLEKSFDDEESKRHLGKMYQQMQKDQDKLSDTTIRMKRLRYFPLTAEEITAGETPIPQQEVKKKLLIKHHNDHHIISLSYHHIIIKS